jgi:N4-gp56 family major capsid protein
MAGQVFAVNSLGGFMYSDNLSEEFRLALQPEVRFRQFCDIKDAFGTERGANWHWNVYLNIQNQGGTLVETNTMPQSNFVVMQGTGTVTEYGNSIPYTGKLEYLAKESVKKPLMRSLKNDAKKAFDIAAHAQFNTTLLRVAPASSGSSTTALTLTTNGTATITNSIAYKKEHAKLVSDLMKERNIPPYSNDDYFAIAWPSTYRTLKNDLEAIHQYTAEGFAMIMNGEIGRYENIRHIEQTFIPKGGAADSTTWNSTLGTADAWNNALSDWIFFFGEDTVAEGISVAEEIRAKIPGDFGRSKGIAWYYLGGFAIVHNNTSYTEQIRIIKWDSAA